MTVIRRLDAVLEPTNQAVLDMSKTLDKAGVVDQRLALRQAAGQPFYNTSNFTLRDLLAKTSQQQLRADFEAYLDGFSPNVQDILENFEFRNQIPRLSKADALGTLIEKLLSPNINLSPNPVLKSDGSVKHPGLDNHAMGTIFEELVRRFNEENNEEAGEHWTPRDAVRLMAKLIFLPVANEIESGTYRTRAGHRQGRHPRPVQDGQRQRLLDPQGHAGASEANTRSSSASVSSTYFTGTEGSSLLIAKLIRRCPSITCPVSWFTITSCTQPTSSSTDANASCCDFGWILQFFGWARSWSGTSTPCPIIRLRHPPSCGGATGVFFFGIA